MMKYSSNNNSILEIKLAPGVCLVLLGNLPVFQSSLCSYHSICFLCHTGTGTGVHMGGESTLCSYHISLNRAKGKHDD